MKLPPTLPIPLSLNEEKFNTDMATLSIIWWNSIDQQI